MRRLGLPLGFPPGVLGGGGRQSYTEYMRGVQSANLVAYWPLSETSGTTADNAEGTAARDATYNNAVPGGDTFDANTTAATFDSTADYINTYTASLSAAFPYTTGTFVTWVKFASGVFTDGVARYIGIWDGASTLNRITIYKSATNNTLTFAHRGTDPSYAEKIVNATFFTVSTWTMVAMTWDSTVKAYINGAQVGTTQTGAATMVGPLTTSVSTLGALTNSGSNSHNGSLAHAALWNVALTGAEIQAMYQAANPT